MIEYTTSGVNTLEDTMTEWLTVKEAAERMGVVDSRVRQLARDNRIRAQRFGRDWQIDAASIVGFEKDSRGRPASKPRPNF